MAIASSIARRIGVGVVAPMLVLSCSPDVRPEWKDGSPAQSEHSGEYFQSGDLHKGERAWYSIHLSAADEPPLRELPSAEAYRFMHLPSFRHPVIIRVESRPHERFIIVKELSGAGGYDPGQIVKERHRQITPSEWRDLENIIVGMRFWSLPRHPCEGRDHPDDGMVWILEGKMASEYAVVQWHWNDCVACRLLIHLAEVELEGVVRSDITPSTPPIPPPPEFGR